MRIHLSISRSTWARNSSVLVPIVQRQEELKVLFTRRTAHLKSHSGQISFPGGRAEPHDASPEATALREAQDQLRKMVGLDPESLAASAREVVDATGLLVLPGVVDVHTHVRVASHAFPDRFFADSVAAALGAPWLVILHGLGVLWERRRRRRPD